MEDNTKKGFRPGLLLKGFAMGIAETIPGVSGGTIAFITGIYEQLINTIKAFNFSLIGEFRRNGIKGVAKAINLGFLLSLVAGMALGIVIGVFAIGYLLEHYQAPLWAFFFGLIIASAIFIARQITQWSIFSILFMIVGFAIAFSITLLSPAEGSTNLLLVFVSGMIAISALILPGISGSFILVLLGMYTIIRSEVENVLTTLQMDSIMVIVVFGLGCLVGLIVFSRVLSYTFKNYKNQTLALLTGFMLGSLNKIWPWRNPVEWLDKDSGQVMNDLGLMNRDLLLSDHIQMIKEVKVLPSEYLFFSPQVGLSVVCFILGLGCVFLFERLGA